MEVSKKPPSIPWIIVATSCGISVGQLDITIVNVALQAIHSTLGGDVTSLQWIVSAYTVAFAALLLSAGFFPNFWVKGRYEQTPSSLWRDRACE